MLSLEQALGGAHFPASPQSAWESLLADFIMFCDSYDLVFGGTGMLRQWYKISDLCLFLVMQVSHVLW